MRSAFITVLVAGLASSAMAYVPNGTKWGVGLNVATQLEGHVGTPGDFSWSIMAPGLAFSGYENHYGYSTVQFGNLLGGPTLSEEIAVINSCINKWTSVCGLSSLGLVADGNVGGGAPEAIGGGLGDMRFGAVPTGYGSGLVLGHAYQPGNESIYGVGGSITGDIHINTSYTYIDNPNHVYHNEEQFDFETVMLHEIGHSLGLAHTTVPGSIMFSEYVGAKRELRPDDIAGIQYIYGPRAVPEPATIAVLGLGVLALRKRRTSQTRISS